MGKKFYQTEKFQEIFYPILYIVLSIALVVSGLVIFYNTYYTPIYVHGSSMMPTLLGAYTTERVHYGIADKHQKAVRNLKRFDVSITYYPSDWIYGDEDTTFKIKRVWGFPGETITLTHTETEYIYTVKKGGEQIEQYHAPISVKEYSFDGIESTLNVATFTTPNCDFDVNITNGGRTFTLTLSEENQEYFLMGDNWISSSDSYTHIGSSQRITKDNIQGKVVCIQGTAIYDSNKKQLVDKRRIKGMYYF